MEYRFDSPLRQPRCKCYNDDGILNRGDDGGTVSVVVESESNNVIRNLMWGSKVGQNNW